MCMHLTWCFLSSYGFLSAQVSGVMSQTIVQKLNGLQVLTPLLKSNKVNIQRNTVALVRNLTQNPNLTSVIGKKQVQDTCSKLLFQNIFSLLEKK